MITGIRSLAEINQQAIRLLYEELGVIDAVRFLKQFTPGYGDYTQERESLFADKSLDDIVSEISPYAVARDLSRGFRRHECRGTNELRNVS
ncbi:MAG: hypothetical protein DDG59_11870 [Anaerolineae bacterium]|jgi:hypothetical protein|nr:MAG: hypothetical protein DDG59_11870 [Anaerolineae bacterium]